ncbi:MAG: hypothetical protein ACQEP1_06410, partial [Nanobdellota archaeon]
MDLEKSSKQVLSDCYINGGIVASNSTKNYYPKEAKYYKYVWPRDAMYIMKAANSAGLDFGNFLGWCKRAERWKQGGLFYKNYRLNGKRYGKEFQPDQTGSILIIAYDYYKRWGFIDKELIRKTADGLCKIWKKDHFTLITEDLWEERHCFPDLKGDFTYSLAACARGLLCADELIPDKRWRETAREMKDKILEQEGYFRRSTGKIDDKRVDASLLGLVWPFN